MDYIWGLKTLHWMPPSRNWAMEFSVIIKILMRTKPSKVTLLANQIVSLQISRLDKEMFALKSSNTKCCTFNECELREVRKLNDPEVNVWCNAF